MRTAPRWLRRTLLAVHLMASVGWLGAAGAYLPLSLTAASASEPASVRASWLAMELVLVDCIVPLAVATLVTGVAVAMLSPWGLFQHYWVVVSLVATSALVGLLVLHVPEVQHQAGVAAAGADAEVLQLPGDTFHTVVALVALTGLLLLNMFKPRGLTAHGWRRQQVRRPRVGA